jgi:REP element-mobilizing transposase RayT
VVPGVGCHITQRGVNRGNVFFTVKDRLCYLQLLKNELLGGEIRVLSYCLMTNHVHLVVIPERADSLAVTFRRTHGRYAQYVNVRRKSQRSFVAEPLLLDDAISESFVGGDRVRGAESGAGADGGAAGGLPLVERTCSSDGGR